ncbi:MAG TPA: hypothetical protein VF613_22260, partial [Longimicrobium sp.]
LDPNAVSARRVVRTSVLHLGAAGHLRAQAPEKRSWFGGGAGARIVRGPAPARVAEHLAPVLEALFPPGKPPAALAPTEVMHRLQRAFGYDYGRYLARHIRPRLVSRGLLEVESYPWLGIFNRRRYRCTPAGARLSERIVADLQAAEEIPQLLQRAPRRAAAAAAALGGLVLIADDLRPHLGVLAEAARQHPPLPLGDEEEDDRWGVRLEAADILTGLDWGVLLDSIDGVGDAFDGGDGGGADGGGDGGSE